MLSLPSVANSSSVFHCKVPHCAGLYCLSLYCVSLITMAITAGQDCDNSLKLPHTADSELQNNRRINGIKILWLLMIGILIEY